MKNKPVIVGSGISGLLLALSLSPLPVILLTRAGLGRAASSALAQGGIAAAIAPDDDVDYHVTDTIAAGDGLVDPQVAKTILGRTQDVIHALLRFGVRFDRALDGTLQRGLEAAHSRRRIIHANGDGTGAEIVRALAEAVRNTPSIECIEGVEARRLLVKDGSICGLLCADQRRPVVIQSSQVVLATGSIGGLYSDTTTPSNNFGAGLAMAARIGARLADLEFIQFHPTALDAPGRPLRLLSEAIRGEGAILRDAHGAPLMDGIPEGDLAPRDVVARRIAAAISKTGRVWLDARQNPGSEFAGRFPGLAAMLRQANINPATDLIPVRPAVHYHMGGIATDCAGQTNIRGLRAIGEVACTGLHGANRLASNSLLEGAAMALLAAEAISGTTIKSTCGISIPDLPPEPDIEPARKIVSRHLGIIRNRSGLVTAIEDLQPLALQNGPASDPALVGLMIAFAALRRTENRGAHMRIDATQNPHETAQRTFALSEMLDEIAIPAH